MPCFCASPVLVDTFLVAAARSDFAAVFDLVVNFGSHFVLQLHDVLERHVRQL